LAQDIHATIFAISKQNQFAFQPENQPVIRQLKTPGTKTILALLFANILPAQRLLPSIF